MSIDPITADEAIKFALPYIEVIYNNLISPFIKNMWNDLKQQHLNKKNFEKNAKAYLSSIFVSCAFINTIAFPNMPKRLQDLYIPLTLSTEDRKNWIIKDKLEIINSFKRILIVDNAGMGKSTVVKKMVTDAILSKNYIPFYLELRTFSNSTNLEDSVRDTIGFPKKSKIAIISHMPYFVVLDGFDEVGFDLRKKVIDEINYLSNKYPDIPIIVTSRPDNYLSHLNRFIRFNIVELSVDESYDLIKKYDNHGVLSNRLIEALKVRRTHHLSEFLITPLYVSLLYCAYRHKPIIPLKRHLFFSQVFEALFESHDLTKEPGWVHEKYSELDATDFHSILRRFAFWCLSHDMKIEFLKDQLEAIISDIESKFPGVSFKASNFVKDLLQTVPLLIRDGNLIRWSHKSLMEYFAAMFICHDAKDKQYDILNNLYKSKLAWNYINILELCCDIDYSTFRKTVFYNILKEFLNFNNKSYHLITNKRIKREWLQERKGFTFLCDMVFSIDTGKKSVIEIFNLKEKNWADEWGLETSMTKLYRKKIDDRRSIFAAICENIKNEILSFVKEREPELFIRSAITPNQFQEEKMLNSTIPKDKIIKIDDNPNNIINNSKNFKLINNFIWDISNLKSLNIEIAKRIVDEIDRDSSCGLADLIKCLDSSR